METLLKWAIRLAGLLMLLFFFSQFFPLGTFLHDQGLPSICGYCDRILNQQLSWEETSKFWGIGIIGLIVGGAVLSAVQAIRAGRFGIKHIKPARFATVVVMLAMGTLFSFGWFEYPDGPLGPCSGPTGYCGKQGQPHTVAEYQAYDRWQSAMLVVWPLGMLMLILLNRKELFRGSRNGEPAPEKENGQ